MSDGPATLNGSDAASAEQSSPVLAALAAAFQHVTIGMAVATPDGRLIDANPAYARMLGYERDELLARGFEAVTHPDDEVIDRAQWERLAAGEVDSYQREKCYLRQEGRRFGDASPSQRCATSPTLSLGVSDRYKTSPPKS